MGVALELHAIELALKTLNDVPGQAGNGREALAQASLLTPGADAFVLKDQAAWRLPEVLTGLSEKSQSSRDRP